MSDAVKVVQSKTVRIRFDAKKCIHSRGSGEPKVNESPALTVRNGKVQIDPKPNGPLLVSGSVEIVSGTGKTILKSTSTALCRCGSSANKPFCDGTHVKIGFKS